MQGSILNPVCAGYLAQRGVGYEEVVSGGQKGLILRAYAIPNELLEPRVADILAVLPAGFPDCPTDMFYVYPWLKLKSTQAFPRAADQPFDFNGVRWQRWSRHQSAWRPGIDGIWTVIARIDQALRVAK